MSLAFKVQLATMPKTFQKARVRAFSLDSGVTRGAGTMVVLKINWPCGKWSPK